MDVDVRIAIPRQPPVLQEHQSLIRAVAFFKTCGGRRGAQWSVILQGPEKPHGALSDRAPSDAAGPLPGDLPGREARPARADRSARGAPSGHGASGHHRHRRDSSGVRG